MKLFRIILFYGLLMVPILCNCQHRTNIDIQDGNIATSRLIAKYDSLHSLTVTLVLSDNFKALEQSLQAEKVALRSGDTLRIRKSKRLKAQILLRLGRPIEARSSIQFYLRDSRWARDDEEQLMLTNLMGVCHLMMGQFDKALEYHLETNKLAEHLKSMEYIQISINNIGITYYKLKAYEKALAYLLRVREIEDSLGDKSSLSATNISLCYSYLGNFPAAAQKLKEGWSACGVDCRPSSKTHLMYAEGCLNYNMKKFEKAREHYVRSFQLAREADDRRMMLDNLYFLTKLSLQDGNITEAEHFLTEAEHIIYSGTPFNMEILKIYEQLATFYVQTKNFDRASVFQSKYIAVRDSLYNEAVITHLMELESEYHERANEAKIAEQQSLLHVSQETIYRQTTIIVLSSIVILLTVVIIVFLFRNYRKKKSINLMLDEKVKERTRELDFNRHELLKELVRHELLAKKASSRIMEKVSTLKGLCFTARGEVTDAIARKYIERIEGTSEEISIYLKSVLQRGAGGPGGAATAFRSNRRH